MIRVQPFIVALALATGTLSGFGQQPLGWRVYTSADGLPEPGCRFVTVGGAGTVFAQGVSSKTFGAFDGYAWKTLASPPGAIGAIYESPAGQLWTLSAEGLCFWTDGAWRFHVVPPIQECRRAQPAFSIALCPVRQNVALFLLPDALMEFAADNPDRPNTRVLRSVNQTSLGRFTGLRLAADDGLWITGERGLARIPGPKRAINDMTPWREFPIPEMLGVQRLRAPVCGDDDSVTCVADSTTSSNRVIVRFDGQRWSTFPVGAAQIEFAWQGPDRMLWAATPDSLLRFPEGKPVLDDELAAGAIFDVAVGAHGMFWLATSEGLLCRVPEPWRLAPHPPDNLSNSNEVALMAQNGDRWTTTNDAAIAWRHGQHWTTFGTSDGTSPRNAVAFVEMPNAKIWCATPQKIWEFDGQNWAPVRGGLGRINAMMRAADGSVWVASNEGLHWFAHGAWIDMGAEEGLKSSVVRDVREDAAGRLWADTAHGPEAWFPEADGDAPRSFIQGPPEPERNIPQGGSITVTFGGRDKWNVTLAARLLFSWRLDDREWSAFDAATSAPFIDLPPGRHYFQVRAMDRNGNIDSNPARLEFAFVLPWYREGRPLGIAAAGATAALFFAGLAWKRHRDLALSYAQVERQVAARTAELKLANEELLQSQKMKALGTLAAGIAHDFNNILSIIKGSAQIIEDNLQNPQKIQARADRIKTVVDQGSAVVQALLGFSRNTDESTELCEVNAVVENTIRLLGDRFLRETDVRFDRGAPLPSVRVSGGLVQQILLNFIFNAAESVSARKEVIISTGLLSQLPRGIALSPAQAAAYVGIAVRDFGGGIAPEILPRIFEPFFTTKALSTRRGTGLGLSVAYELAQKMGAGLAVESTPGHGSVFTLLLPAALAPSPAPTAAATVKT